VPQQEVVEIFMHLLSTWFPVSELELDIGQMHKLCSLLVGDMDLVSVKPVSFIQYVQRDKVFQRGQSEEIDGYKPENSLLICDSWISV
jgi:hypothetical protein